MRKRNLVSACVLFASIALLVAAAPASLARAASPADPTAGPTIIPSVHNDISVALTAMGGEDEKNDKEKKKEKKEKPHRQILGRGDGNGNAAQPGTGALVAAAPALLSSFDGIGNGFSGPNGTFTVNSAPPDTNGAVGPNHYVETVNSSFAIFNKSGTPVYGPVPINQVWSGFGGGCQTNNDGDPTAVYDSLADRWIISQFSVTTTPYLMCVAVSTSPDPTGSYYRYSFSYGNTNFPDYPKLSVWPDAYYLTVNFFANGTTFAGAGVAALDRAKMLAGQPATQQLFQTSTLYGGLLAATIDGSRQPPAGSPNYVVALGNSSSLLTWKYHVDWTTPANSTFTGPGSLAVASYAKACNGGTCIPQIGTTQRLDSLADRVMYRLAYRNFSDHEALVVSHSVTAGSSTGVRWYELRPSGGNLTVFQQGTYAPDSSYRWMGSIAMDQAGGIGLGFSISSSSLRPGIHYAGRLASDPAGQMTQGEGTIIDGAGVQTGRNLSRWGDYSSMSIDPVDGCTFWYANEYIPANGSFNWSTRIGTFKLPGCGTTPPPSDFSITANPASVSTTQNGTTTSTISTAITSGSAQTISLSASGLPAGASASFSPATVTSGGSSTLTLSAGTAAPGTYTVTVTGTGTSATHTTTVSFTISAPVTNDFSISASPASLSLAQGANGTSTISTAVTSGAAETVDLAVAGAPAGATATLNPTSVTAGASSTLTVGAGTAAPGTYTLTVTGTAASASHTTTVTLTITAPPPPNDFSISANPASVSAAQGGSATSTISTAIVSGTAESVTLSAAGLPTGTTASFNPASVTTGGSSTLTLAVGATTATGTYSITVTGTAASAMHTTTVSLTVTAPPPSGLTNGGFESGLTGWTVTGSATTSSTAHGGTASAMVGSSSPFNGDSSVAQTFTAPAAGGTLSFWYRVVCTDTVTYDWATATLRDNTTGTTVTVLAKTCTNTGVWNSATAALTASRSYTLTLIDHDDNYATDPTYTLYDDVQIGSTPPPPPPSPITNGGFETGTLDGWTSVGSAAISLTSHTGSWAARVGSTSAFNGDSSVAQTFTAPASGGTLTFWYRIVCTDTVTYDWATATLRDNTTGTTTTVLPKACTNSGAWSSRSATLVGSHSYTLTLIDHDDNYATDPTYTLYDDVTVR